MKIYTKTGDAGETGLFGGPRVRKDHARIEAFGTVDELNSHLGMARTHSVAAAFHVARTVCRRAERRVVTLASEGDTTIPANAIEYLNRLGDLLFVLARVANRQAGVADDPWIHP